MRSELPSSSRSSTTIRHLRSLAIFRGAKGGFGSRDLGFRVPFPTFDLGGLLGGGKGGLGFRV